MKSLSQHAYYHLFISLFLFLINGETLHWSPIWQYNQKLVQERLIFFPKMLLINFGRPKLIVTRVIIQSKAITALTTYLMRQKTVMLAVVRDLKPSLRDWKEGGGESSIGIEPLQSTPLIGVNPFFFNSPYPPPSSTPTLKNKAVVYYN